MKKTDKIGNLVMLVTYVLMGFGCGALLVGFADPSGQGFLAYMARLLLGVALLYAALMLQIIFHEGGHLVFGLLSGYRFVSFRIGSFLWIKQGDGIAFRRYSLTGTAGQCLLEPPEWNDGIPYVLYNLGGITMNFLTSGVSVTLAALFPAGSLGRLIFGVLALAGFGLGLTNGIPLHVSGIDNDGMNVFSLGKNKKALRAFWIQMLLNKANGEGVRLRDMPKEWFPLPDDEAMANSMTSTLEVFRCNRLMDEHRFAEAEEAMSTVIQGENAVLGIHKNLLTCDRILCEALGENRKEVLSELAPKKLYTFFKTMKNNPTILRTEIVLALFLEKDEEKAEKLRALFEKVVKNYPYGGEVETEREFLSLAEERAEKEEKSSCNSENTVV